MQDNEAESQVDNISWLSWLTTDMVFLDFLLVCQGDRFPWGDKLCRNGMQSGKETILLRLPLGGFSSDRVCTAGLTTTEDDDRR